jgi:hypothetical protein
MFVKRLCQGISVVLLMICPAFGHGHPSLEPTQLVGSGILKIYWAKVYTLSHYHITAPGPYENATVLTYDYLRDIPKEATLKASLEEFARYPNITKEKQARWMGYLDIALTDMAVGDHAEIWHTSDGSLTFFTRDHTPHRFDDAEFAEVFMNIWLGENTNYPELRQHLLGQ